MKHDRKRYLNAIQIELEPNIVKHSLALEACMGGVYDYLKNQNRLSSIEPDRDDWMLAGLIHDIDFSESYKATHPLKTKEVLAHHNLEIDQVVEDIVKSHGPSISGFKPQLLVHHAIFCADSLTGLITAVALVYPSKKLADVKLKSVIKRFLKDPRFAAGTRRDEVATCADSDKLNIPLEKFIEICFLSMQSISKELGL